MTPWLFALAILAGVLDCPAIMWLGRRRGIGPGCAVCPPRCSDEQPLDELRDGQRTLPAQIDELEARRKVEPVSQSRP